ncbi:MAG: DUF6108 family protein [Bacteroidales bacterium]|jgi:hypothetical protein|nr:DUF6108 family protein [Bacteroidales bacterium]
MKAKKIERKVSIALLFSITLLCCGGGQSLLAQANPAVFQIFEKYSKQKKVTLLEVSEELMAEYRIKQFKSIIFEDGTLALPEIRRCIEQDKQDAKKLKEATADGLVVSGYYRLKTVDPAMNRYLIFKVGKKNKVTLLYIEGRLTPEELVELLK